MVKRQIRSLLARPSVDLASRWPSSVTLAVMRRLNQIQLGVDQLALLVRTIQAHAPCRLLVFGLGHDSRFWARLNRGGVTVFLEDDPDWVARVLATTPSLTAYRVCYGTSRQEWRTLLDAPARLQMALPTEVAQAQWDVILVDAPAGWGPQTPGRMQSIYTASRLAKAGGDVFVHDCNREVEAAYCHAFFNADHLAGELPHPEGWLRHYHVPEAQAEE